MSLRELPRRATNLGLSVARVPLSATEALLGHRDDPSWLPTKAFDRAGAVVRTAVGTVVRDPELVEAGHLTAKKVERVEQAEALEAAAEARRRQTGDEVEARRAQAAERRREAARTKQQRQQAIAAEEKAREREAADRARRREDASERVEEAATEVVERQARRTRQTAVAAEEAALDEEQRAMTERQRAAQIEAGLAAKKAKRRTGSS